MDSQSNKLPVIDTFKQALNLTFSKFDLLVKFAIPLISIQLLLIFSSTDQLTSVFKQPTTELNVSGLDVIGFIIYLVILVMTIISCHRIFLLDDETVNNTKILRWGIRELKYVGWVIVIAIIMFLIQLAIGILIAVTGGDLIQNHMVPMAIGFFLMISYFTSRLSLLFPATAVDNKEANVEYVWRLSNENSFRLMFLISILPALVNLLISFLPTSDNKIYLISTSFIWLIVGVVEICLLSLSYDFLSKQNEIEINTENEITEM